MNMHDNDCHTQHSRGPCNCSYTSRLRHDAEVQARVEKETAAGIATWMEGLAGHFATPQERRDWYRGVAMDIRHMGPWKADAEYRRKNK